MICKMQNTSVNWGGIFTNAYTYTSSYLLLSLIIIIASIIWVWIYEKPQFYKLIFKKSKQSTIWTPIQSSAELDNAISNFDTEVSEDPTTVILKRLAEINTLLSDKETPDTDK